MTIPIKSLDKDVLPATKLIEESAISTPFIWFAQVAERVAATTKRLEKARFLAEYFLDLSDSDLMHAARYFAGYVFPLRDQRTINVGGSALMAAILILSHKDPDLLQTRMVALGDIGELASEAFLGSPQSLLTPTLTLAAVATGLEVLASTAGSGRKRELVVSFLRQCSPQEAKYLVKILAGDLRIGLLEGAVEDAIARWANVDVAQVQWANMLVGDIGEAAVLARHRRLDTAKMRFFHPIKFMLATPAADFIDIVNHMPNEFIVEDKFDGIRAQAHIGPDTEGDAALHGRVVDGVRVALFSRTLDEITESFPELVQPLAALLPSGLKSDPSAGYILDGEILTAVGDKILPFQVLQKRLGRKAPTLVMQKEIPVAFVAYDALYGNGKILIDEPWKQRRACLDAIPMDTTSDIGLVVRRALSRPFQDTSLLDMEFDAAQARGNEGLMVKDPNATYKPGRRGREWLKIKRTLATLDVVVTSVEVGNGARRNLLSAYTFAVRASETDATLLNVGRAYSGLTDVELATLTEWFRAHTIQEYAHGKVHVVAPEIVIEVTFNNVQVSTRHKGGYALRFPRILRLRPDKTVDEIDTLETVRQLTGLESVPTNP